MVKVRYNKLQELLISLEKEPIRYVFCENFNCLPLANFHVESYCTVALYIGFGDFGPKLSPKNQLDSYLLSDGLGVLVRHSQAQRCLQINPKPLH